MIAILCLAICYITSVLRILHQDMRYRMEGLSHYLLKCTQPSLPFLETRSKLPFLG